MTDNPYHAQRYFVTVSTGFSCLCLLPHPTEPHLDSRTSSNNASWPTSDDEVLSLNMKTTSKPNLKKLMNVSQHFKNLKTKLGLVSPGDKTLFEDDSSDNKCEDVVGIPSKPSVEVCDSSPPALPSPDSLLRPPFTLLGFGLTKEGEEQPEIGTKDFGIIESVPKEQTVNDTSADRADKNDRHVMLSALRFAEQNEESPWDSESNSESLPEKYIDHLPGNADQKGTSTLNEQVEDSLGKYSFLKPTVEEKDSVPKKGGEMEEKQASQSDSPGKCFFLKPSVEVNDSLPNKPGEMEDKETSESNLSNWKSTHLNQKSAICQRSRTTLNGSYHPGDCRYPGYCHSLQHQHHFPPLLSTFVFQAGLGNSVFHKFKWTAILTAVFFTPSILLYVWVMT
ncbi:LOW QUALITY PROTEIN: ankyrin repeat domain-containing protein 26-like [Mustela lutreola]|uniref:LOW QUALITY PROTEIN: ankyrin repeat domain-containing protein 26-like n=1 Tax=Mustela lutreola TaxID=9666 RepID=UPI00279701F0|nr:LOW QUALITY PROTEIN: ankyrin repeat domain-containing protein 26-like [Mustela lutreola]